MSEKNGEPHVHDLLSLTGKVALVTGACGYLGQSMARALVEAGATVAVSSTQLDRAQQFAELLSKEYETELFGFELDHTREDSIASAVDELEQSLGRVDILVNNGHQANKQDWRDADAEGFAEQLANATGYFLLARHVRDLAVRNKRSASIVMLGSMYGLVASYPDAYAGICPASPASYHALKGGIIHLTRHLAAYWASDEVRVNCLSPGAFPSSQAPQGLASRLVERVPLNRLGKPYELKGALVFLASDASSYVTGHNLVVDGGWTIW